MYPAKINPHIIRWARNRLNLSFEDVAQKISVKPNKVKTWEMGESLPTFGQAQKLAKALSIPLGYLFLSEPPKEEVPIPDLRTLPESKRKEFSPNFFEVLYDALRKRDWYREFRIHEGMPPLEFVGMFKTKRDVITVAESIREHLGIKDILSSSSWQDHLQNLIKRAENAGILVLCNGLVGNNPHKKLSIEEFRGFCIVDEFAPIIFVNKNDTKAAQIFTLAHELAHIWIGESGVSNITLDPTQPPSLKIEKFCNQVAAEFLVPAKMLTKKWNRRQEVMDNVKKLARMFKVSTLVILRRGYDLDLIPKPQFQSLFIHEMDVAIENMKKTASGGDTYLNIITRNSARFVRDLLCATLEGKVLYREAARLLNVNVDTVEKMIQRFLKSGPENALLLGY